MKTTAKVRLGWKHEFTGGVGAQLQFAADYADGSNKEWAAATPYLNLQMTVSDDVAKSFVIGDAYTLTFEREGCCGPGEACSRDDCTGTPESLSQNPTCGCEDD